MQLAEVFVKAWRDIETRLQYLEISCTLHTPLQCKLSHTMATASSLLSSNKSITTGQRWCVILQSSIMLGKCIHVVGVKSLKVRCVGEFFATHLPLVSHPQRVLHRPRSIQLVQKRQSLIYVYVILTGVCRWHATVSQEVMTDLGSYIHTRLNRYNNYRHYE